MSACQTSGGWAGIPNELVMLRVVASTGSCSPKRRATKVVRSRVRAPGAATYGLIMAEIIAPTKGGCGVLGVEERARRYADAAQEAQSSYVYPAGWIDVERGAVLGRGVFKEAAERTQVIVLLVRE